MCHVILFFIGNAIYFAVTKVDRCEAFLEDYEIILLYGSKHN